MNLQVDIQCASAEPVPEEDRIRGWIAAAVDGRIKRKEIEVSVRLVDTDEMTTLNETYRGKNGPTNVLSFAATLPEELDLPMLGDIVICAPVVKAEANAQHKPLEAHWAHMVVHGALHLLGYDHINEEDAVVMEALESAILQGMDFNCPYADEQPREVLSQ